MNTIEHAILPPNTSTLEITTRTTTTTANHDKRHTLTH